MNHAFLKRPAILLLSLLAIPSEGAGWYKVVKVKAFSPQIGIPKGGGSGGGGAATSITNGTTTCTGGTGPSFLTIDAALAINCDNSGAVDTAIVAKGSSDATKKLRFEVDGFTTGNTRVMTPPNQDATLAGINVSQSFSSTQTIADDIRIFIGSSAGAFATYTAMTPDSPGILTGATSNTWHVYENADVTFDFNNCAAGTAAGTDPAICIHSAVQDKTQFQYLAVWGQAGGAIKTLTESAATPVIRIPVATLNGGAAKLFYRVLAADASNVQVRAGGGLTIAVVNVAGTETCGLSAASEAADGSVAAVSAGTLTYAITCDTTPANAVDISFNAVSSLTQTTLNIQYFIIYNGPALPARQ